MAFLEVFLEPVGAAPFKIVAIHTQAGFVGLTVMS